MSFKESFNEKSPFKLFGIRRTGGPNRMGNWKRFFRDKPCGRGREKVKKFFQDIIPKKNKGRTSYSSIRDLGGRFTEGIGRHSNTMSAKKNLFGGFPKKKK